MPAPLGRWCPLSLLPWPSLFPWAPWPVVVGVFPAPPEKLAPHVLPRRYSVVAVVVVGGGVVVVGGVVAVVVCVVRCFRVLPGGPPAPLPPAARSAFGAVGRPLRL